LGTELPAQLDEAAAPLLRRARCPGDVGIPATGKSAVVTGIAISRFARGQIVEDRVNWDTMGLLRQLGIIPSREAARV
jgi:SnoaL-like polyketide cyclase